MTVADTTYRFQSPAQLIVGDGACGRVGSLLDSWAVAHDSVVALVGDADVLRLGLAEPLLASLIASGYRTEVLACKPGEPTLEGVDEVVAGLRSIKPAACVGLGGGSTLDVAKLAAALTKNPGEVPEFIGAAKVRLPSIPTIMVPTTAGTGSEATQVAMLSINGKKVAAASSPLMARAAILDPGLTIGLPQSVTAASGLDALAHSFESFLSTTANLSTEGASLHGASLIASSIRASVTTGRDRAVRMTMLTGAYWAGLALNASVVLGHSIAYTIANRSGLPHGVTCAMALPYCLAYNEKPSSAKIERIAHALREQIGVTRTEPSDPTGIYSWLVRLERDLDVPESLAAVGLERKDLPAMVKECLDLYPRANNPAPFDYDSLTLLYDYLFDGDVHGCATTFRKL